MGAAPAPLRAVLEAAGDEARRIAASGLDVQDALSTLLGARADAAGLQALDTLVQQAQGLGAFLSALAGACPDAFRADPGTAASCLRLGAQRRRLALEAGDPASPASAGLLELF